MKKEGVFYVLFGQAFSIEPPTLGDPQSLSGGNHPAFPHLSKAEVVELTLPSVSLTATSSHGVVSLEFREGQSIPHFQHVRLSEGDAFAAGAGS